MVERLILGSGSLVTTVASAFDGQVRVATPDDSLETTLQGVGIEVEHLESVDEQVLSSRDADLVVVLEDSVTESLATARIARAAMPAAYLVAYADTDRGEETASLAAVVDEVLGPGQTVGARLLERVGGPELPGLWRVLRSIDRLAVVSHDNPDPDAIASGVALTRLADDVGCDAEVCYYGDISHQENRAFVNVLDLDLQDLDNGEELSSFDGVALVDHGRPGVNDQLPSDTPVDIVLDHHPPQGPVDARFVDLRSDVGATSTLLVEYFERAGREIDTDIATALLFGIHVDTDGFRRGVSAQDFEAAATLVDAADLSTLERFESPSIDRGTFDVLARAIEDRRVEDNVVFSSVGAVQNRDVLPQIADRLLQVDGITVTVVYGAMGGCVYVSARSRVDGLHLGEIVREAYGDVGSAGGHVDMAGAQLGRGVVDEVEDDDSVAELAESIVTDRFLDVFERARQAPPRQSALGDDDPYYGASESGAPATEDADDGPDN
jgi:nanoRNase/pAp phosphatase (c-di-AMP/oligoRNAs hydrolase)